MAELVLVFYLVRVGESGPIKIGFTETSPRQRLLGLQTNHHETLILIGVFKGTIEEEKRIHRGMKRSRIRGEWFEASAPVMELVADSSLDNYQRVPELYRVQRVGPPKPRRPNQPVLPPPVTHREPAPSQMQMSMVMSPRKPSPAPVIQTNQSRLVAFSDRPRSLVKDKVPVPVARRLSVKEKVHEHLRKRIHERTLTPKPPQR